MASPVGVLVGMSEPYTRDKLFSIFSERPQYHVKLHEEGDSTEQHIGLQWVEYEDIAFDVLVGNPEGRLCNAYCIRKGLIRKAQLAYVCKKYVAKHLDSILARAVPETYQFEMDDPYYFEEAMNDVFEVAATLESNLAIDDPAKRTRWILKPSLADKAAEILVFDSEQRLRTFFEERYESADGDVGHLREWVIQRYIDRPLLLRGGRKFHVRTYVLAVGSMKVFVYEGMLALFASNAYEEAALDDRLAHITNTCVQAAEDGFVEDDVVRAYWSLADTAEIPRAELDNAFDQIKATVGALFDAVSSEVTVFQPLRNAFELFGLDFLIDDEFNVHLLEANAFPDFKQTGRKLQSLIDQLFRQTVAVAVDPYFGIEPVVVPKGLHLVLDKEVASR
eukprot:TRINITY_DN26911_c0_g1_i1.p1 TRINITY_DN26911_c0_g1~~TRINITY_DN26911_c0_g1_i1.p1  ORF type:complete len:392 (-),score=117.07 TRINITY_DN26911_c0_g1_i1:73-1248(-)